VLGVPQGPKGKKNRAVRRARRRPRGATSATPKERGAGQGRRGGFAGVRLRDHPNENFTRSSREERRLRLRDRLGAIRGRQLLFLDLFRGGGAFSSRRRISIFIDSRDGRSIAFGTVLPLFSPRSSKTVFREVRVQLVRHGRHLKSRDRLGVSTSCAAKLEARLPFCAPRHAPGRISGKTSPV